MPSSYHSTVTKVFMLLFATFGLLAISVYAQSPEEAELVAESSNNLFGLLKQGGWAMWPLGLCSLMMFFLFFYCLRETFPKKFIPSAELLSQVKEHIANRNYAEASTLAQTQDTVLSRSLTSSLAKVDLQKPNDNKEKVENLFGEVLGVEESRLNQWINYLNVIASVSPMIGLLGTVSGMISAFQTISSGGMGRPELLASDIGEALITTATGLVIGIPAMIAFYILRNRLNNIMSDTVQTASDLIDSIPDSPENPDS